MYCFSKIFNNCKLIKLVNMANLPPRKISTSGKVSKQQGATPLEILLQMGFPRNRALKALAATGHRSVQLASDWLLTHVNDAYIDAEQPREYIFYANPTGQLLAQLQSFWQKSKATAWNGAHNFPPHITLVPFFKAKDDVCLQLAKSIKQTVEVVGQPPETPLKLESYISQNFMGLFISEEHSDYLKNIALQYAKQVSALASNAEAQTKSLHLTLAYHFDVSAFEALKALVDQLDLTEPLHPEWELRLYSRDPRFSNHQVFRVMQGYAPVASDELELVVGDYVYIEEKQFDTSPDGWVYGTSWLTGVSGYLPAVYTRRTPDSDVWTLHRAISLKAPNNTDSKSESDSASNTETETASYSHEDAEKLGYEKSEETYQAWQKYWMAVTMNKIENVLTVTQGGGAVGKSNPNPGSGDKTVVPCKKSETSITNGLNKSRRWIFALRHGERVDLTYGSWVPFCFDENGTYVRKDLNMPLTLVERAGGAEEYVRDCPLTRVGQLQARLVGEGLRLAGVSVTHVYSSSALRSVETAHHFLKGLEADPSVKIKVDPGLFEYKGWHLNKGLAKYMTPQELHKGGYNVDLEYKPYTVVDTTCAETIEDFYKRNELVMHSAVRDTEEEGGNVIFIGHASTLDTMAIAMRRLADERTDHPPYKVSKHLMRVPYCALGAVKDKPWEVVSPPCPPSMNSSSGRFDWKVLLDLD
ncbi:protein UBASH3A homolog isoform X2 [Bicyclus anynana]|uniref:Ecdysteroid-phosphate phosphatase n=1 Tax=Bicyclus anynana TaxID=110368 RepID=A0A6J1MKB6_BICAN|nr:protein UBASH3A homolog isoform X2 [Bicyclus anynana]